ncbi:MAG: hypothetical protein ACK4GN_07825 [Runella sp.]
MLKHTFRTNRVPQTAATRCRFAGALRDFSRCFEGGHQKHNRSKHQRIRILT